MLCTILNLFVAVVVIIVDFIVAVFPERAEATIKKVGRMLKSSTRQGSKSTAVAPTGPLPGKSDAISVMHYCHAYLTQR